MEFYVFEMLMKLNWMRSKNFTYFCVFTLNKKSIVPNKLINANVWHKYFNINNKKLFEMYCNFEYMTNLHILWNFICKVFFYFCLFLLLRNYGNERYWTNKNSLLFKRICKRKVVIKILDSLFGWLKHSAQVL